jgi:hypothetical protein
MRTFSGCHAVPGHDHQTATSIMQAVNRDAVNATEDALRLIDESHSQLLDDRTCLSRSPVDRRGPFLRRRRAARVDVARLACPPFGREPRQDLKR